MQRLIIRKCSDEDKADMTLISKSKQNNFIKIALILFAISLPFHAIEWDLFSVSRFEIKITMITFMLLAVTWFFRFIKFERKRCLKEKEKLFYTFAFIYGLSQFASLLNSPMPEESLKQAVIISCLLLMMVIVSESIATKETVISLLITMGIVSLVIGILGFVYYAFFTEHGARLGNSNGNLGLIYLGGDAPYFGDLLLYSMGPVFYVVLNFFDKKSWAWVKWLLLILWFSAIILTYTKAMIVSVVLFLIYLCFVFKKHRFFIVKTLILSIVTTIIISNQTDIKSFLINKFPNTANHSNLTEIEGRPDIKDRLNILSPIGKHSFMIRAKAVIVSLSSSINPMEVFWFGNGAGLSQKLLPAMADSFEETLGEKTEKFMEDFLIYGDEANKSLLDAHNLFLTEFFNVGVVGVISLLCLIALVVVEQIRIIKSSLETDHIIHLLSATLIAMLFFRLASSFVVIPSLWFMLGLSFGACKLYWSHPSINACKEIHNQ